MPFASLAALVLALPLSASAVRAQAPQGPSIFDDSDIAGRPTVDAAPILRREARDVGGTRIFRAQSLGSIAETGQPGSAHAVGGTIALTDPQGRAFPGRRVKIRLIDSKGRATETQTDESGRWTLPIPQGASGQAAVRLRLENPLWSIQDPNGKPYEWDLGAVDLSAAGTISAGSYTLDPASQNGKMGYIHLQLLQGFNVFEREGVSLAFWKKQLTVIYPGSGDYTSPLNFSINLTQPEAWDVNLHEFGHAVMAAGTIFSGAGGQHYIDRCYDEALAYSEGWATFFATMAGVDRNDPDAKLQYMVPRRAPVRIENVPSDVCAGPTNEWRVAAGFWDLYDTHADGPDVTAIPFAHIWAAMQGRVMNTFRDAWSHIQDGLSPQEVKDANEAIRFNTLIPAAAPATESIAIGRTSGSASSVAAKALAAAPDWDGRAR